MVMRLTKKFLDKGEYIFSSLHPIVLLRTRVNVITYSFRSDTPCLCEVRLYRLPPSHNSVIIDTSFPFVQFHYMYLIA